MPRTKTISFSESALELFAKPSWKSGKLSPYISGLVEAAHREWQAARHTLHVLGWRDPEIVTAVSELNGHVVSPATPLMDDLAIALKNALPERAETIRNSEPTARALLTLTQQYWLGCEPLRQTLKSATEG